MNVGDTVTVVQGNLDVRGRTGRVVSVAGPIASVLLPCGTRYVGPTRNLAEASKPAASKTEGVEFHFLPRVSDRQWVASLRFTTGAAKGVQVNGIQIYETPNAKLLVSVLWPGSAGPRAVFRGVEALQAQLLSAFEAWRREQHYVSFVLVSSGGRQDLVFCTPCADQVGVSAERRLALTRTQRLALMFREGVRRCETCQTPFPEAAGQ